MKFLINISVLLVYLSLSVGFNIMLHTCGEYTSAHLMPITAEDPCSQGRSHGCCASNPCCKLEIKVFHLNDFQLQTQIPLQDDPILLSALIPDIKVISRDHYSPVQATDNSPPVNIPRHILDCIFLI